MLNIFRDLGFIFPFFEFFFQLCDFCKFPKILNKPSVLPWMKNSSSIHFSSLGYFLGESIFGLWLNIFYFSSLSYFLGEPIFGLWLNIMYFSSLSYFLGESIIGLRLNIFYFSSLDYFLEWVPQKSVSCCSLTWFPVGLSFSEKTRLLLLEVVHQLSKLVPLPNFRPDFLIVIVHIFFWVIIIHTSLLLVTSPSSINYFILLID